MFVLVNSKFTSDEPDDLRTGHDQEQLWVRIRAKAVKTLYVGAFYRPPSATDPDVFQALESSLSKIPPEALIWLGGDFNLASIDWENMTVKPNPYHGACCKYLLDNAQNYFLEQLIVTFATRTTEDVANTLDLFFTNNKTLISNVELHPGISDHDTVLVNTSLRPDYNKSIPHKIFLYHKANFDNLKADILKSKLTEENGDAESMTTKQLWDEFKNLVKNLIDKHIPSKISKRRPDHKPWITQKVKRTLRKEKRYFKKARSTGNIRHIQKYKQVKSQ